MAKETAARGNAYGCLTCDPSGWISGRNVNSACQWEDLHLETALAAKSWYVEMLLEGRVLCTAQRSEIVGEDPKTSNTVLDIVSFVPWQHSSYEKREGLHYNRHFPYKVGLPLQELNLVAATILYTVFF